MTGQLNTNLLNSNSEEIQEELDTLSNRLDGVESVTSANTDKINEVDNRVDNLANCVSTDSLNATNVAACNIQGSSATITSINSNNVTVSNKLKAANIEADNITGTINGNVSANTVDAATANITTANVTEKITAASAEITNVNATNANITNGNISALCTDGITATGTITSQNVCVKGDINVDGCIIGPKKIVTPVNGSVQSGIISGCDVYGAYVHAKDCLRSPEIYGNVVNMSQAYFKNASISNLKVSCSLELASGITLPNTLGDTTLTKVTTDCLLVNGNTELNGAVKAGSITIGDGSITAGEVCIGAKGIVIDKDKNATLAAVIANTITADAATISGKVTAACTESTDVVSTNTFAKNFYPENITIDKDVGDLHYSRQLDTDALGAVLVDCKTILPKEVTHSLFPKNGYIETETSAVDTTYAKNKALKYSKRGNGLSVSSMVYRPDVCHSKYKTAVKFITGCSDPGITGCCGKGFTVENNGDNGLSVSYFYDNCHCPFIDYNFCDTNKNTSTVIGSCNLDVTSKNINVKNISTCSVSDDNKVLKVDNYGNVYSGKITSSLIGNDNVCRTCGYTCLYQTPAMRCCYQIYCVGGSSGSSYKENIDEKYYYCNIKKLCNVSVTDYRNKCGCEYVENITPMNRCYSYCKFGRAYNSTTCVSCESYCLDCYNSEIGNPTVLCHHYYCCSSDNTANTKNYWDEVKYFSGGRYNQYGLYPTYICRCFDCHPELSFCAQICNDNLYITNPQCNSEDILRVEDGKIYTKCGEFKAGGGGYFTDSTFSNDCIRGSRSVVNDTITTCVIKSITSKVDCYSFETSTPNSICFGFGTNCCLTDSNPIPENNYNKSYLLYTTNPNSSVGCCCCYGPILCTERSQQCSTTCPTYKSNSCYNIVTNEYCYNYKQISPTSGNVICCCSLYKSDNCNNLYISRSDKNSTRDCYTRSCKIESPTNYCCVDTNYWCQADFCNCSCQEIRACYNGCCCESTRTLYCTMVCFTDATVSAQCYNQFICTCCLSIIPPSMCITRSQYKNVVEGDTTEICLGNYCSNSCDFVYNYSCSCGVLTGCSYMNNIGVYKTCYNCYPQYDCNSTYTRYFNGDRLCGCKYNATTCQYEAFRVQTCININDKSIDKSVMINNCNISLKEKVTTNQIANLPITNTLVPLAGKVNGKGFAFFCKGADGIKFYDGAFATVNAGTATDVTYLVTTGV